MQGVVWDELLAEGHLARSTLYAVGPEGRTRQRRAGNVSTRSRPSSLCPAVDDAEDFNTPLC